MPIEIHRSKTHDALVVRYLKGSTLNDGTQALHEFVQQNPSENTPKVVVIDATDAVVEDLTFGKVSAEASKKIPDLDKLINCQKMAMVARNDVQFGFLRMYEVIAFEKVSFEMGAFSNDSDALDFVGLPFTTIDALIAAIGREFNGNLPAGPELC